MKKAVLFILDEFADWEAAFISTALTTDEISGDYEVQWASTDRSPKRSMGHLTVIPDLTIEEIPQDIDALILIGGLSWHKEAAKGILPLARSIKARGGVLGIICDATHFAAREGLLNDVRHTGNDPSEMAKAGGYTNPDGFIREEAVSDQNVITANGNSPVQFAALVLKALGGSSDEEISQWVDFYTMGYWDALKKHGYL